MSESEPQRPAAERPRVAVTGSSGLVGSHLSPILGDYGYRVQRVVRHRPKPGSDDIYWNLEDYTLDAAALDGVIAVVHLAGKPIVGGRWTDTVKEEIRSSRVLGTRLLCETLAGLSCRPRVLVAASALGYYPPTATTPQDEDQPPGDGFLSEVCQEWEAATAPASAAGIRVVNLRIGIVLSPFGGALAKMLPPFRLGLGGRLGSGKQIMSWIALGDLIRLVVFALERSELAGPVNATAPQPVSNAEFTKTLGRVLGRPTVLPVPTLAVRLLFGEMGDTLLLQGCPVLPQRARTAGFKFEHPALEGALRAELGLTIANK